jgi:hypothetical protein
MGRRSKGLIDTDTLEKRNEAVSCLDYLILTTSSLLLEFAYQNMRFTLARTSYEAVTLRLGFRTSSHTCKLLNDFMDWTKL